MISAARGHVRTRVSWKKCSGKTYPGRLTLEDLAVPRVLRRGSVVNSLDWQTALRVNIDPQRLSGALANQGASPQNDHGLGPFYFSPILPRTEL
jgi:hypothetical protein